MTSTINKGLDKVKEGVTSAGEGIHDASDYVGAKMTGAKDCVKEKSTATYDKASEGVKNAGEFVGDKFDAAKKVAHDKTSSK